MPGIDGVEACRLIRDRVPGVDVVMLTSFDDEDAATASILAGSRGFLLKNGGPGELFRAVRAAVNGETLLDPALAGRVVASLKALATGERGKPSRDVGTSQARRTLESLSVDAHA